MPRPASYCFECAPLLGKPVFELVAVHRKNVTDVLNIVNCQFNRSVNSEAAKEVEIEQTNEVRGSHLSVFKHNERKTA